MMKNLCLICLFFLIACAEAEQQKCEEKICSMEFRTIGVTFKNAANQPIDVLDFKVVNTRTNQTIINQDYNGSSRPVGYYTIVTDASLNELSAQGDKLLVSAKNPTTNITTQTEFVVSGGGCNCHINKVSGPTEIIMP